MALDIDAAAHEGALDTSAPAIAVMGTGPDRVYRRATGSWRSASQPAARCSASTPPARPRWPTTARSATA